MACLFLYLKWCTASDTSTGTTCLEQISRKSSEEEEKQTFGWYPWRPWNVWVGEWAWLKKLLIRYIHVLKFPSLIQVCVVLALPLTPSQTKCQQCVINCHRWMDFCDSDFHEQGHNWQEKFRFRLLGYKEPALTNGKPVGRATIMLKVRTEFVYRFTY